MGGKLELVLGGELGRRSDVSSGSRGGELPAGELVGEGQVVAGGRRVTVEPAGTDPRARAVDGGADDFDSLVELVVRLALS